MHENGESREFPPDLRELLIRHLIRTNAHDQMQRNVSLIRCRNYRKKTASDIAREKSVKALKSSTECLLARLFVKISETLDLDHPGSYHALESQVRKNVHAIMLSPVKKE